MGVERTLERAVASAADAAAAAVAGTGEALFSPLKPSGGASSAKEAEAAREAAAAAEASARAKAGAAARVEAAEAAGLPREESALCTPL